MSNFVGQWTDDKEVPMAGLKDFMDKQENLSNQEKEKLNEATNFSQYIYKKDEDEWLCVQSMDTMPGKIKEIPFKSGVPFENTEMDGSHYKATVTVVNDSEMQESGVNDVYGPFEVYRKVEGNKMKITVEINGMKMTNQMKRM